ncbi:MAG: pseudaminic acid synthase [Magnetospirillum sp.]|nr:pseudaminic acid synthase [Magnetospirillum sp.]
MKSIDIDGRRIASDAPPYVIAEISGNHNASLDRAFALMDAAKTAGADAVKLQTYTADTITLDIDAPGFVIEDGLWKGRRLYELYDEAHTPWAWMQPLFEHGRRIGITVFSSPFDATAVDLLENLQAPAYKIASFEMVDLPLVRRCAATGKPLVISTGMADETEIGEAVAAARDAGAREIALLHCVSGYPAPAENMNLRTIADLASRFEVTVGLSDHTLGIGAAVASVALGAAIVEKHLTLKRSDGGPDAAFSLEPTELATLCREVRTAWHALGRIDYGLKSSERSSVAYRRSLYVVEDVTAGEPFTLANVRSIRPGHGLPPRDIEAILGRPARMDVSRGTPLSMDLIDLS